MNKTLTDEQYNLFLNANTLEDYEEIKSLLQDNNSTNILSKDLLSCRVLSNNEYDKYIINGTCNGAILAYNINTYHHQHTENLYYSWGSNNSPYILGTRSNSDWRYGETPLNKRNFLYEIVQNNTSSNSLIKIKDFTYYYYAHATDRYHGTPSYGQYNVNTRYVLKQDTTYSYNNYVRQEYYQNGYVYMYIYVNGIFCFRPVFQYKDSKKSNNIYY